MGVDKYFYYNIYASKYFTYKNLKAITKNKDLVVISGNKDSFLLS